MTEKDKFQRFLPDRESDKLSFDAPIDQPFVAHDRIPSANDPMGQIKLEGRAYGSLAGGRIPWWVLISGWILWGIPVLLFIYNAIMSMSWASIPVIVIASLPILILWRGTHAKFSNWRRTRK
jgi:hypothetical protein